MISVIVPYWKRQKALRIFLRIYRDFYGHLDDLEVVVVDDGSPPGENARPVVREFPCVRLVEMPRKHIRLNPCVVYNRGVREATGEVLLITSPEVHPRKPILEQSETQLIREGPKGYVAAACWDPNTKRWNQHSLHRNAYLPFHVMLYRQHYLDVGGYDEDYRDGHSQDDVDFIRRLRCGETVFVARDDLVTDHHFSLQGSHDLDPDRQQRNRQLLRQKWGTR